MATNKSSPKAKTKKSQTKITKTAASTKKSVKAPAKQGKQITLPRLRSLHMMSAGLFVLLALAAGTLMGDRSYQVTLGYLTPDTLTDVLTPAARVWFDIELRWALVGILLLSAVLPILYQTKLSKRYEQWLKDGRFVPARWADFAVTGAAMTGLVLLMSGMQDYKALKLAGLAVIVSFWLAGIVEWHSKTSRKAWKTYVVAVIAMVFPLVAGLEYAVNTMVYGGAWSPWYVMAAYAVLVAGFAAIFRIQYVENREKRADWKKNYLIVERNYVAINMLMKTLFAVVLIAGLR